jgi:hypothetical protein
MKAELKRWLDGTSKFNVVTSEIALVVGLFLLGCEGSDTIHLVGFAVTVVSGFDLVKRYRQRHRE